MDDVNCVSWMAGRGGFSRMSNGKSQRSNAKTCQCAAARFAICHLPLAICDAAIQMFWDRMSIVSLGFAEDRPALLSPWSSVFSVFSVQNKSHVGSYAFETGLTRSRVGPLARCLLGSGRTVVSS